MMSDQLFTQCAKCSLKVICVVHALFLWQNSSAFKNLFVWDLTVSEGETEANATICFLEITWQYWGKNSISAFSCSRVALSTKNFCRICVTRCHEKAFYRTEYERHLSFPDVIAAYISMAMNCIHVFLDDLFYMCDVPISCGLLPPFLFPSK